MQFKLIKKLESGVRVGKIQTAHGVIHTPFFMPVGTVGSVKGILPEELIELGAEIVLANTYHLYLRPGEKNIKKLGGLHRFMNWSGPILTDSGGYQVFSLAKNNLKPINNKSLVRVTDNGVEFTSHLDGSKHFFTPEKVIQIQLDLGSDIIMPLDYCPSGEASQAEIERAVRITIDWAKRSKRYFDRQISNYKFQISNKLQILNFKSIPKNLRSYPSRRSEAEADNLKTNRPALFGIIQGGLDLESRKYCAEEIIKLNFDGYAVGGLAVDLETRNMWKVVKLMGEILPEDNPRYLMGVGTPDDIIKATSLGMDMYDCVLPTRLARHGSVFVNKNRNPKSEILNPNCHCEESSTKQSINNITTRKDSGQAIKQYNNYKLVNLLNSRYRINAEVIDSNCQCPACANGFSKAYISHLIREKEMLGPRLTTLHNLYLYLELMRFLRN